MAKPPRDYAQLPPDDKSSVEVLMSNRLAARVWAVAETHRGVVQNKDEVISDLIEGWLDEYVRKILKPREAARARPRARRAAK